MQHLIVNITKGDIITAESIQLKTDWSEVTLAELIKLTENSDSRHALAILSGREKGLFGSLTDDVVSGLMAFCWKIQMVLPKADAPKWFRFNDTDYVVADLIDNKEWGAYEDCRKAIANNQDLPLRAAPMLLAIYCRPRNEVYDYDKALRRAELFKGLPAPLGYALCFFF